MTGDGRHPERVPLREQAESLPPAAYGEPVHELTEPVPVYVWISRPRRTLTRVEGFAVAWTTCAGRVRYRDEHGREDVVWVWANAIRRRA